jgi:uncharacterized protein YbaP (TraB family)
MKILKKYTFLLFILTSTVSFCTVHAQVAEIIHQDTVAAPVKSLLWEITGKNLKKPSYLYGTIHMIDAKDFFLTEATKQTFDASERVTFEIDMEDMTSIFTMFTVMTKVMMKDGVTLKDLLSSDDYTVVKNHFETLGLPMFMMERIKPMFLSAFSSGDAPSMGGLNNEDSNVKSYEMEFMKMAKAQNKEMEGLETIAFQMGIFDSIPYKAQAEMLVESIKAGDAGDTEMDMLTEIYKQQDIESMHGMVQSDSSGIDPYEEMLLVNRNRNWIPLMADMMKKKSTFFAVGAGHLGGDKGVINLLRKEGYTLKPLF